MRASAWLHLLEALQFEELAWLLHRRHHLLLDGLVGVSLGIGQWNLRRAPRAHLGVVDVPGLHLHKRSFAELVLHKNGDGCLRAERTAISVLNVRQGL